VNSVPPNAIAPSAFAFFFCRFSKKNYKSTPGALPRGGLLRGGRQSGLVQGPSTDPGVSWYVEIQSTDPGVCDVITLAVHAPGRLQDQSGLLPHTSPPGTSPLDPCNQSTCFP
jgi:hypothetical protein